MTPKDTAEDMGKYEQPLLITYGWSCPVHGSYHQRQVALASQPRGNKIIDQNTCTSIYPNDPVYRTRLYGNLKLEVNRTLPKKETR